MGVYRLAVGMTFSTAFPRDRMYINPHFATTAPLIPDNVDQLCEDLATAINTWCAYPAGVEITVKGYDAQSPPPNQPLGSAIRNTGTIASPGAARELAICLSYYAGVNAPRRRGRLYVPFCWISQGASLPEKIASTTRDRVGQLVPILASLGGVDVDWVVFSRRDNVARKVTNWWVDDEWDVQRRRGLRTTTRTVGTTSG